MSTEIYSADILLQKTKGQIPLFSLPAEAHVISKEYFLRKQPVKWSAEVVEGVFPSVVNAVNLHSSVHSRIINMTFN